MARVTVEDCVEQVPNRFDLVMLAAQRAKEIASGGQLTVERDNDKNPVVALREIAERTISLEQVHEGLVRSFQKVHEKDEPEEDNPEFDPLKAEIALTMREEAPSVAEDDLEADMSVEGEGTAKPGADD